MREVSRRNILRQIEDLTNRQAKDYTNIHLIPRGTPLFPDKSLRGTIRFAKRQGNFLPVIQPDNSVALTVEVTPPTNRITVTRVIPGLVEFGTMISIGPGLELAKIFDVDTTTGTITTESDLIGSHPASTPVDVYGVPAPVIGNWYQADQDIQLRSQYPVMPGDQIAIDTTKGVINSTVSTLVTVVQFLGISGGLRNYQVSLEQGISRDLVDGETIYLRAQPGYESGRLRAPSSGPFVLDYISGPFFENSSIDDYLNVKLFDAMGSPLLGYENTIAVGKNFPVSAIKILTQSMLFWDVVFGTVQFHNEKFVAITDEHGRFTLSQELVPAFPPGTEWDIPVVSDSAAQLRVKFEPNGYRDFALSTGILQRIRVGSLLPEEPGSRIEIVVKSLNPYTRVEFNDWIPVASMSYLSYQITSTAYGTNVWQSGSLMLKPYFFVLDDLAARHDFSSYDQGVVHF